jgi:hypothetical protein
MIESIIASLESGWKGIHSKDGCLLNTAEPDSQGEDTSSRWSDSGQEISTVFLRKGSSLSALSALFKEL